MIQLSDLIEGAKNCVDNAAKVKPGEEVLILSDTNVDPDYFDACIPGNDDAISSLTYILSFVFDVVKSNGKRKVKSSDPVLDSAGINSNGKISASSEEQAEVQ